MTVGLTYDATLSRVRVAVSSLPTGVDTVVVERSTNQINWVTVRGGGSLAVVGGACKVDDYEFAPDVVNYYRVTTIDAGPITYIGAGAATSGNNPASLSPALPVGWQPGDLALTLASIRNAGSGVVHTPAGWTSIASAVLGNVVLLGRRLQTGDTAPVITFGSGVANADAIAQCAVWRNASTALNTLPYTSTNSSAQNIDYPPLSVTADGQLVIVAGWKADDWTSVATLAGATEVGEAVSTAGDDAGQVWDCIIQTTAATVPSGSFVVTGGASAISRGMLVALGPAPWRTRETNTITPTIGGVWIKSITRPFLNRQVDIRSYSEVTRPARTGVFNVIDRSFPVAVTNVRGSRRWQLQLRCESDDEAENVMLLLTPGDALLVQTPASGVLSTVPAGYVVVGDTTEWRLDPRLPISVIEMPCTEVAAPGADVVGATATWLTVRSTYATWATERAAVSMWADLSELVGDPGDVVVP